MALFSCVVGITTEGRLDIFDIVFHLTTGGAAQAYDPLHLTTIYQGYVVQGFRLRCESNHAQLVVLKAFIYPNQRSVLIEFTCQRQRNTMLCLVCQVLGWIEIDLHL